MHSAGPRTLAADRSVYALWPLATGCHTIDYYYYCYQVVVYTTHDDVATQLCAHHRRSPPPIGAVSAPILSCSVLSKIGHCKNEYCAG